jgi:streptogramin lyase
MSRAATREGSLTVGIRRWSAAVACAAGLAGCSRAAGDVPSVAAAPAAMTAATGATPSVYQNGKNPGFWTQFSDVIAGFQYPINGLIVAGPDGNMWLGNQGPSFNAAYGGLLRVSMAGKLTLVPLQYPCNNGSTCTFYAGSGIAVGSDGKFYLGNNANVDSKTSKYVVGVATPLGKLAVYDIPSGDQVQNGGYALGPDKNVWFAEEEHIGKITPAGKVTEYKYPTQGFPVNSNGGVTSGPDGNVWFSEGGERARIGKIVPSTGKITEYNLTTDNCNGNFLGAMVSGQDGNLYVACGPQSLAQISTTGSVRLFTNDFSIAQSFDGIGRGPDGNPWLVDSLGIGVGEFNPVTDSFTDYFLPSSLGTGGSSPQALALGPDGNLWTVATGNKIDVFIPDPLSVKPADVSLAKAGASALVTVSEAGTTAWTATSTHSTICAVKQASPSDRFELTAKGVGSTDIIFADRVGNSFIVGCKVQ